MQEISVFSFKIYWIIIIFSSSIYELCGWAKLFANMIQIQKEGWKGYLHRFFDVVDYKLHAIFMAKPHLHSSSGHQGTSKHYQSELILIILGQGPVLAILASHRMQANSDPSRRLSRRSCRLLEPPRCPKFFCTILIELSWPFSAESLQRQSRRHSGWPSWLPASGYHDSSLPLAEISSESSVLQIGQG